MGKLPKSTIYLYEEQSKTHVYLIGTFHLSRASAEDVRTVIRCVRPRTVMIELCEGRYMQMMSGSQLGLNSTSILREMQSRRNHSRIPPVSRGTMRIARAVAGFYGAYKKTGACFIPDPTLIWPRLPP